MDAIFRALAEPVRRDILDALRRRDGQTVSELEAELGVSRFVVINHLKTLEEAHLVTRRRAGRHRYVHINPMPIKSIADRWINPMVAHHVDLLSALKRHVEGETLMSQSFQLEIFIKTTPERLWRALTDPTDTAQYYFGTSVEGLSEVGTEYAYKFPDGSSMLEGRVLEFDPPRRLKTTFKPRWGGGESRETVVTFSIEAVGNTCRLTLVHEDLTPDDDGVRTGWAKITSALKTWLETREALPVFSGAQ